MYVYFGTHSLDEVEQSIWFRNYGVVMCSERQFGIYCEAKVRERFHSIYERSINSIRG